MLPPDRILPPVPGPPGRGDEFFGEQSRRALEGTSRLSDDLQEYLRGYRPVEITTADGQRLTVLARGGEDAASTSRPFWHCRYESAGAVNVARGLIEYLIYVAGEDRMDHAHNTVSETALTGLVDGDVIYCMVEVGFSQLTGVANDGTNLPVWTYAHFEFRPSNLITKLAAPAGSPNGIYDQFSAPSGTVDTDSIGYQVFYFPIAQYRETDGVGRAEQWRIGAPIFVPFLSSYHSYPP